MKDSNSLQNIKVKNLDIPMDVYFDDLFKSYQQNHPHLQGQELEKAFTLDALNKSKKLVHLVQIITKS